MTEAAPPPFGRRVRDPIVPSASDETFWVPVEMVLYQASTTSLMILRRAKEQGATFAKRAMVWRVGDKMLARVDFLVPVGSEDQSEQLVQLSTPLWENLS